MNWHDGDVFQAVNKVNEPNKFLIVYLRDESSLSGLYTDIFEKSEDMHNNLSNCVCLNLSKDTKEFQQFSDVYKAADVPSIYIISYLGKVIEIIKGEIDGDKLVLRLKEIVLINSKDDKSVENDTMSASNSTVAGEPENPNVEEKLAELRQKLAEKQRQRQEEEKAKSIEEELNRRDLGKKLVELKKFQKEQEEKEVKDEIRRQKESDKEARLKVLRQIEEDKQERRNRFTRPESSSPVMPEVKLGDTTRVAPVANNNFARLQFRFPDGSSKNNTFDCNVQFSVVRQFVATHVRETMENRKFEIKQFFPKKTLSVQDDVLTLTELGLVPSASLAVLFVDGGSGSLQVTNYTGLLLAPINFMFVTIVTLVQWVRDRVLGTPSRPPAPRRVAPEASRTTTAKEPEATTATTWEDRQRRLIAAESRTIKKEGNLAQFSDTNKDKAEEDDATWNGNSTQQM